MIRTTEGNVRQRGDKWYYSFEAAPVNGKRQRIERVGGLTKKEAQKALRKAIDDYERGGLRSKLEDMSVSDYMDYWLKNYVEKNLKYNTRKNYSNIIENYIKPKLGKYRIKTISPAVIQQFINEVASTQLERTKQPPKKHTVEIVLTVIKEALKRVVFPYQVIKENPAGYVEMPKYAPTPEKTRQDLKIISYDQYEQLLKACPPADSYHMPLVIAFNTGMRRGEALGLTWDRVNLDEGWIKIDQQMIQKGDGVFDLEFPKSQAGYRIIEIGRTLIEELKAKRKAQSENRLRYGEYYNESNFVCTWENGNPVTPGYIKYRSRKLQDDLGFPFSFHSLRHTHATMLLESGEKLKVVQERLGHAKMATTADTYLHVTQDMRRRTVDLFENFLKQKRSRLPLFVGKVPLNNNSQLQI
ncbi:MAG: site-specific integrase [Lactobacillus sp.]|jgi:ATP-dependent helicase/nuclease subunit A|nr:site-specific integrase [Lactobacillus sp.]MCI2033823.1 site-specific integrase [Lactobacillus sp.]